MELENLRSKIKELNKVRDQIILEKGFSAEANKDLRENAEYDYWVEQEIIVSGKIGVLIKEIQRISIKNTKIISNKPNKDIKSKPKTVKISELPKNKWL